MNEEYLKMLDYYPKLVEEAISFKIESRRILALRNGMVKESSSEDEKMGEVDQKYRIIKDT